MTYKIIRGVLKGRILNTSAIIQTVKNKVYGYVGWTPYLLKLTDLKQI